MELLECCGGLEGVLCFARDSAHWDADDPVHVARQLPADRLLIETDSPFLPPQGHRGKSNEASFVLEVAKTLANVRDLTAEEIGAITAANFRRFFRLEAPPIGRPAMEGSSSLS